MNKKMRKAVAVSLVLITLQFVIGIYLYPRMPEKIAIIGVLVDRRMDMVQGS
jgi:uncharacterized membrane protein